MDQIDEAIEHLARTKGTTCPNLERGVWEQVGRIEQSQLTKRNALLAGAILVFGFGGGLNFAVSPAQAHATDVYGAAGLSPSELLHVSE